MTQDEKVRLSYRPSLDGIRGVAVLMVMAHHAGLARGGFLGVDVFFVLSGYLITALLMQEWERTGSISLRNFYARRALRLLPALLVLLAALLVAPRLFGLGDFVPWRQALIVLSYWPNWASAFGIINLYVLSHTWSLGIEEQFYLLWPPLLSLLLALRVGRTATLGVVLTGILGASVVRWTLLELSDDWRRLYYGLDTRMDSLLLGCLIGLLAAWGWLPKQGRLLVVTRYATAPAVASLLALTYRAPSLESEDLYQGVGLLACLAVSVVLVTLLASPPRLAILVLEQPMLVWIGRISYGLYLWHVPIFQGVLNPRRMTRLGIGGLPLLLLRFGGAFAVASASFYLVELPMLRL
jgi:peptidoglycan/LPS O-acetylase OafA/YrhL